MAFKVSTAAPLHNLTPGRRVADAQTDLWVKLPDGTWQCTVAPATHLSAEDLQHVWGPVTIIPEEGI